MTAKKIPGIYSLMQMLVLTSFIGFLVEDTFKIFKNGYFDNRFMFLPFLLGYGFFAVLIGVLAGTPKNILPLLKRDIKIRAPFNYIVYFLAMAVLVSAGELALGFTVEWVAGFYYWDYTNIPLNFTRYTSLPTSLGFGFIITLFMSVVYQPLMNFFETRLKSKAWRGVTVVLTALLVVDFIASFAVMIITGDRNKMKLWEVVIFNKK